MPSAGMQSPAERKKAKGLPLLLTSKALKRFVFYRLAYAADFCLSSNRRRRGRARGVLTPKQACVLAKLRYCSKYACAYVSTRPKEIPDGGGFLLQ